MYVLTLPEKRLLRQIASFYGCKVKFEHRPGGVFIGKYIKIGYKGTRREIFSIFCHELAHFINWKTGRYPIYHNPKNFDNFHKCFRSYGQLVRYSLNAEIFTDKQGAKLCKEWFPGIKYEILYKNTKLCYEFLAGYYFRG